MDNIQYSKVHDEIVVVEDWQPVNNQYRCHLMRDINSVIYCFPDELDNWDNASLLNRLLEDDEAGVILSVISEPSELRHALFVKIRSDIDDLKDLNDEQTAAAICMALNHKEQNR